MNTSKPSPDELWVSDHAAVYHKERGVLCQIEKHYDCFIYYPILFKARSAAYNWIEKGTIAELQEGLGSLGIGFVTMVWQPRND